METDTRSTGFADTQSWSTQFDLLLDEDSVPVQVHNRPVYVGTDVDGGNYDVLLFTGRRFVLTHTGYFVDLTLTDQDLTRWTVAEYLKTKFHAHWSSYSVSFISEPMDVDTPKDSATPVGLQWFHAMPLVESQSVIQQADTNRPSGAVLLCAICNNSTNPCLYGNLCRPDGSCHCMTGSSGTLCQVPPVHDGRCDTFFNTAEFEYDGGDCCQEICVSTVEHSCGNIDRPAFDLPFQEYVGYPFCSDSDLCDSQDGVCWNQVYEVGGEASYVLTGGGNFGQYVALSGNGAVLSPLVPIRDGNVYTPSFFVQDGKQRLERSKVPNNEGYLPEFELSDDGGTVALVKLVNDTFIVQVFWWEAIGREWIQLGVDIPNAAYPALSGDGKTIAVMNMVSKAVEGYHYESWTGWKQLPGWRIGLPEPVSGLSLSGDGTVFARTSYSRNRVFILKSTIRVHKISRF